MVMWCLCKFVTIEWVYLKKEGDIEYEVGDLSLEGFVALRERSAIKCVATVWCHSCPSRLEVAKLIPTLTNCGVMGSLLFAVFM